MLNQLTGKPWCHCMRMGCHGGLRHYTFGVSRWYNKKRRELKQWYRNLGKPDLSQLENIEVEGIDTRDYPDFCDAYISYAEYKGRELTQDEIDWVNEHTDFIYECVIERLF